MTGFLTTRLNSANSLSYIKVVLFRYLRKNMFTQYKNTHESITLTFHCAKPYETFQKVLAGKRSESLKPHF